MPCIGPPRSSGGRSAARPSGAVGPRWLPTFDRSRPAVSWLSGAEDTAGAAERGPGAPGDAPVRSHPPPVAAAPGENVAAQPGAPPRAHRCAGDEAEAQPGAPPCPNRCLEGVADRLLLERGAGEEEDEKSDEKSGGPDYEYVQCSEN